ncbi:MAG: heat-inducible transcriptional repressor HrcA, partial [Clostridia bacterium]
MLSDRKKKILCAVVDGYIETASPVSSQSLAEKDIKDCSSATIRNELSALESMGYLVQPHISSGRVPSQKAFRLYVDELMDKDCLTATEINAIDKCFSDKLQSVEDIVANVAKALTDITNYTSVVVKEHSSNDIIRRLQLVGLSKNKYALVIVETDNNILKDNVIDLPQGLDDNTLSVACNWLNEMFVGLSLEKFVSFRYPMELINKEFQQFNEMYKKVIEILKKLSVPKDKEVICDGSSKIFDFPEYTDIASARNFLSTIEHKDRLAELFTGNDNIEFTVKLSDENEAV